MKKVILVALASVFVACGGSEEKKKGFEYNRTKAEQKKSTSQKITTPIEFIQQRNWSNRIDAF